MKPMAKMLALLAQKAQSVLNSINKHLANFKDKFSDNPNTAQSSGKRAFDFTDIKQLRHTHSEQNKAIFKQQHSDTTEHYGQLKDAFDEQFHTQEEQILAFAEALAKETQDEQGEPVTIDAFATNFLAHHNHLSDMLDEASHQANTQQQILQANIDEMVISEETQTSHDNKASKVKKETSGHD